MIQRAKKNFHVDTFSRHIECYVFACELINAIGMGNGSGKIKESYVLGPLLVGGTGQQVNETGALEMSLAKYVQCSIKNLN